MEYGQFEKILNRSVFGNSKIKLLEKIANEPERFVGLFRPTSPKSKVVQHLCHSQESKFGDALEAIIKEYLELYGCEILSGDIVIEGKKGKQNIDILFRKNGIVYCVEQKMRDDHDNSNCDGQFNKFKEKLKEIANQYGKDKTRGFLFFVDSGMSKHKKFYQSRIFQAQSEHGLEVNLVYGEEFFDALPLKDGVWNEITKHLIKWRRQLPNFPEFNYDNNAEESFNEIKDVSLSNFRKVFTHEEIGKEILPILFPTGETLHMLADYWGDFINNKKDGKEISELIKKWMLEVGNYAK